MTDRRVIDELEIRNLAAAYSHAVMRRDAKAAAEVYAEDGVLSGFKPPEFVGRAKIAEVLALVLDPLDFIVQTITAGMVDLDGDKARSSWSVVEWFRPKGKTELMVCLGVYDDLLERRPEGWRFVKRSFNPFYRGSVQGSGKAYEAVPGNQFAPWPLLGPR